jgi:hypothetical protein
VEGSIVGDAELRPRGLRRPHPRTLLIGALLVASLGLRLEGIATPTVVANRELYGDLVARQYYYGQGDHLPSAKRTVVRRLGTVFNPIEPPVLNVASALGFRLTGGENMWIPRLLSSVIWVIGGIFLYLVALHLMTRSGALVALLLYLLWPFGVWISRHGMPDGMTVALLLAATLTVIRYWEQPSSRRLVVAGIVSSVASAAKPGVAFIFLVVLFAALALSQRAFLESITRGRLPLFIGMAAAITVGYYVYGRYFRHFLSGESEGRIVPGDILHSQYWEGWWSMIRGSLPYPQQGTLVWVPLVAGFAGVAVTRRGIPRTVLIGLLVGYVLFGLAFTEHISTHSYYSLPLIAILSLAIGSLVGFLLSRSTTRTRALLIGVVVLGVGATAYKDYRVLDLETPANEIAVYQQVGEITGHTTRALIVDPRLTSPICYWGWIVGHYWYQPTPEHDLPVTKGPLPPGIYPRQYDYLIVMDPTELRTEPELRRFTRRLHVVARTGRYAIFDLRGWRSS